MKYEIHNTGDEALPLSNGNTLAPGESATFEYACLSIGAPQETTLQHIMDKLHALERKIFDAAPGAGSNDASVSSASAASNSKGKW